MEVSNSFIVVSFDELGHENHDEFDDFDLAVDFLSLKLNVYNETNGSMMAEPFMNHPNGSGMYWCIEANDWI